jgi:hypothetical protein
MIWERNADAAFSTRLNFTDQKGPIHLKIVLHYWGKQRACWGKCPSSYIYTVVKKCPGH